MAHLRELLKQDGFSVTRRTVERDLQKLLSAGFPMQLDEDGDQHRWSLMAEGRVALPEAPSVADALLLVMVRDYVKPLLPNNMLSVLEPTFEHAGGVIASARDGRQFDLWRNRVRTVVPTHLLSGRGTRYPPSVLPIIAEALFREQQVWVTFDAFSYDGDPMRLLNPIGLVQRGMTPCLVASSPPDTDVRLYELTGAMHAKIDGAKATPVDGFDLDVFLAEGRSDLASGAPVRLKLEVSRWVIGIFLSDPLSGDQVLGPVDEQTGRAVVSATVVDTPQLRRRLIALGPVITLLDGPELF